MDTRYFPNEPVTTTQSAWPLFLGLLLLALVIALVTILVWWLKHKSEQSRLKRSLELTMLQVSLPRDTNPSEEDVRQDFRELIAIGEPLIASFQHLYDHSRKFGSVPQEHITFEIAAHDREIFFYVGVSKHLVSLIEKQIHAQYPDAMIEEIQDYTILRDKNAKIAADQLKLAKSFILPIRTYRDLESSSLNVITNTLSKLGDDSTAAIQFLIRPNDGYWRTQVMFWAKQLQLGKGFNPYADTSMRQFWNILSPNLKKSVMTEDAKAEAERRQLTPMQEEQLKLLNNKSGKVGFDVQIRIIATAPTAPEAKTVLENISSSFAQFTDPTGNSIQPAHYPNVARLVLDYILRTFTPGRVMILNTEEITSLFHFPNRHIETPNIRWLKAKKTTPPPNLPTSGRLLGVSHFRGEDKQVFIKPADRMRHLYAVGKTGVGKSTLLQNMIVDDIKEGLGVAYLDPHGDSIEYIMRHIPENRIKDVIIFDPSDTARPLGLNLLEWSTPQQRDFLVQEAVQIFYKLFDPNQTGIVGPQFEHWLRNAALTLMSDPNGGTLIEIPRLFVDKQFETQALQHVTDPVVRAFWEQQMSKTSDFHKSEMLNYFTSKFGRFMTNTMIRNIIGQPKSAFDFRKVMDEGKILLVNLSKGKVGEVNSNLLGMILVSKLQVAAMSRADVPEDQRPPFYLYVDEFQNFTTDAFASILSEARKYGLALSLANQYIEQLTEQIRNAVVGNAGTIVAFRVGAADAEFLVHEFQPLVEDDLINIDKYNFYLKLLIDNRAERPFNCEVLPPDTTGTAAMADAVRHASRTTYGQDEKVVEAQIIERSKVDQISLGGMEQPVPSAR
ncbi:MAG: TraM recognition domain-containing protein [Patescibacteria group bacterium]|jgi:hypothetical protein